ncbi:MAG: hypothetical protein LBP59_19050 [Planctomycetaceae bacterium]|nr:hypothetical protein [Planctomycetaceae bacterium]
MRLFHLNSDSPDMSDAVQQNINEIYTFADATKELRCSCFSPDSTKLLLGSNEGTCYL